MADSALPSLVESASPASGHTTKHSASVRVTHWLTLFLFLCLLLSGVQILISHPRFYWGESGHSNMEALFTIPIPASRGHVPTGYDFTFKDQNSWSRSLHFQSAWFLLFTGLWYVVHSVTSGHLRKRMLRTGEYNAAQRLTYLAVVFVLFPLMFWTGLAMSPTFMGIVPLTASVFGGQQSARTIHFFLMLALVSFTVGHVWMIYRTGFRRLMRAMITGRQE